MKIVYIAHPLSGDWEGNIASAKRFVEVAVRSGYAPVAPYLTINGLLHEPDDRELGMSYDIVLLEGCEEIWLCGDRISSGMQKELDYALELGLRSRVYRTPEEIPDARVAA